MTTKILPVLALCLSSAVAPGCSTEDNALGEPKFSPRLYTELDATLLDLQSRLGVRSIMAGIFVKGVGSWQKSVGFADADLAQPQRGDHHIRIGSITKTITVTMILILADRGVLTLDDPISRWAPEAPNGGAATLRELANMTSGYGSYSFDPSFQALLFGDPERHWAPAELAEYGVRVTAAGCAPEPSMCFAPSKGWAYSNTNTLLLGMAIERATKKSYADNLRELITEPLGMKHTFQPATGELPRPYARGYTFQGLPDDATTPQEATTWDPSWGVGVGDLVSTFDDLRIWARALGRGALLTPGTYAKRLETVTLPPNAPDRAYAVGVGYTNGWWGHGGELPGYNTVVYHRPDVDATLVVSVNQDQIPFEGEVVHPAYVVADAIIDIANREAPLPASPAADALGSE